MSAAAEKGLGRLPLLTLAALLGGMQLVFWQNSADAFAPPEMIWTKTLAALAIGSLFALRLDFKKILLSPAAKAALALTLWILISGFTSPYINAGIKTAAEYALYSLLFFIPALLASSERRRMVTVFVAACFASALYGIAQHFGLDPWRWSTNFLGRPLGTMGNPNFFAGHLIMPWAISLVWALTSGQRWKKISWLVFGLFTLVQYYSMTVGAWLGMAFSAGALLLYLVLPVGKTLLERLKLKRSWLLGGTALILVLSLGLAFSSVGQGWWKRYNKGISVTNRLMMWNVALDMWKEKPVQGTGWGVYRAEFPKVQAKRLAADSKDEWNYVVTWLPHQNYLYWLAETGAIGLGAATKE